MRNILLFVLLHLILSNMYLLAQDEFDLQILSLKQQYAVPRLTQQQMYADVDSLLAIVARCNPQYLIKKRVTGYDMCQQIKILREQIVNIEKPQDFILLLDKMIKALQDQHTKINTNVWWYSASVYKDDIQASGITDRDFAINFHYQDMLLQDTNRLRFFYLDGKYFLKYHTVFINQDDSITVPSGTEIMAVDNDCNIFPTPYFSRSTRWDFDNKRFYYDELSITDTTHVIQLKLNNQIITCQFTRFVQQHIDAKLNFANLYSVLWLAQNSVLYLKIPIMAYSKPLTKSLYQKLQLYKNHPVKAVVIDIRGNYGGNDLTWIKLLGFITHHSFTYPYQLITTTDKKDIDMRLYHKHNHKQKFISFDCLSMPNEFRIYKKRAVNIKKNRNSLNYNGIIYILVDRDIYSSARGLASLNTKTNTIKTIGIPTGMLQGEGLPDHAFILPHSRLIFTLDLSMDATNINNATDFYFDKIDYPVQPSIDYFRYWYHKSSTDISQDELYQDEFFLKAMDIIRNNDGQHNNK